MSAKLRIVIIIFFIMETLNKLTKLSKEEGLLKGGFATLSVSQISKLKGGGSGDNGTNTNCMCNGNNCKCNGNNCNCY